MSPSTRRAVLAALLLMCTTPPVAAHAQSTSPVRGTMGYLSDSTNVRLSGFQARLGDVNADRFDDVALWSEGTQTSHVVFGQREHANADLSRTNGRVFVFKGALVQPAGDVNGDGTDDVLVIEQDRFDGSATRATSTIVFGGPNLSRVRLDRLGRDGFTIRNGVAQAAGDLNADGRGDLFVITDPTRADAGRSFLLKGKTDSASVDAQSPGSAAQPFLAPGSPTTVSVPAVDDYNGDGVDDAAVIWIARETTQPGLQITVIFGRRATAPVRLDQPGATGYRVLVPGIITDISSVGDTTGDGRADLYIKGDIAAHIIPGQSAVAPATTANAIRLPEPNRLWGSEVVGIGDQTGDGRADLLIAGEGPVGTTIRFVAGRPGPSTIARGAGAIVPGAPALWAAYSSGNLAPAGDVDGDGFDDVLSENPEQGYNQPGWAGVTIISRGRDVFAPVWFDATIDSNSFKVGANATMITLALSEGGTAELVLRNAAGGIVNTRRIPVEAFTRTTWDGRVNGRALAPGNYTSTVTVTDATGNRSQPQTVPFTIVR